MDFLELAKRRYSCRSFRADAVENDKLTMVLEAARIAPSAVNYQPWHFYVIRNAENKAKIAEAYPRDWLKAAPVIIVACGNRHDSWKRSDGKDHLEYDISITVDHITLQAAALGLGTCWICNFQAKKLQEIMHLPSHVEPLVIVPLGYPQNEPDTGRHSTLRKTMNEIISWEIE